MMSIVDVARVVLMTESAVLIVLTTWIIVRYAMLTVRGYKGLLTIHIITIATSYLILNVVLALDTAVRLGSPWTWRLPLSICALSLGMTALLCLMGHVHGIPMGPKCSVQPTKRRKVRR